MSGLLIDTNVLSELARQRPEAEVAAFFFGLADAHLSVVTIHELRLGLALLPEGSARRTNLESKVDTLLERFSARVLPLGVEEATRAASLRAAAQKAGRTLHPADAVIAATALAHGLSVATRNEADFVGLGVRVVNPWRS